MYKLPAKEEREKALARRHVASEEEWSRATHPLVPLAIGTVISVQNQMGLNKTKWDNSGVIVECIPHSQYKVKLAGTGRITLRNRVALRHIVPYGVSIPTGSGLELERLAGTGVQEGPRTLHSKASLNPKTGEVVVGSSPHDTMVSQSVPVVHIGQEGPEASEEARGLVVPKTTCARSHVIPQGLPNEIEVSQPSVEPDTADVFLRRISRVRRKPDRLIYK